MKKRGGGRRDCKDSLLGERKDQSKDLTVVKSKWSSSDMMTIKLTISPDLIATKII